jgi:hypothetical protein
VRCVRARVRRLCSVCGPRLTVPRYRLPSDPLCAETDSRRRPTKDPNENGDRLARLLRFYLLQRGSAEGGTFTVYRLEAGTAVRFVRKWRQTSLLRRGSAGPGALYCLQAGTALHFDLRTVICFVYSVELTGIPTSTTDCSLYARSRSGRAVR